MFKSHQELARKQRFSIKKYSFGAASVLIGVSLLLGAAPVLAQEQTHQDLPTTSQQDLPVADQGETVAATPQEPASQSDTRDASATVSASVSETASSEPANAQVSGTSEFSEAQTSEVSSVKADTSVSPKAASLESVSPKPLASQQASQPPVQETVSIVEGAAGFTLQYNRAIASKEAIKFAVWTERQGQDDLVWYDADANGAAFIDFARHKEYGKYNIHTYSSIAGRMIGRDAKSYTLAEPKVAAKFDKTGHNTYQVTISNVPSTITSISLPTWSDKNGQDDIKWYVATKDANQTYTATINTPEFGHYSVHVYGKSSVTGGTIGLMATPGLTNADSRDKAKVTVQGYAKDKTKLTVQVNGANAKTIQSVSIAAWSDKGGQDDLKWYSPAIVNNSASQVVDIKDLSNTSDTYHIHAYTYYADGTVDGQILGDFAIQKAAEKNQVAVEMTAQGLAISLESTTVSDYRNVRFAVWSDKNGQDDLKWYNADASGKATAPYQNHKDYGKYNIHTYLSTPKGMVGLTATSYSVPAPIAKASVTKVDDLHYAVTVTDLPAYISSVSVPVWSEAKGQDDIEWVKADRQADGSYTAQINLANHNLDAGRYNAHVYGRSLIGNNSSVGLTTTSFTADQVPTQTGSVSISQVDQSAYTFTTAIKNAASNQGLKAIKVAVWTDKDGQDDMVWEDAKRQADGSYQLTTHLAQHNYESGRYHVHVYHDTNSGMKGIYAGELEVAVTPPARRDVSVDGKSFTLLGGLIADQSLLKALASAVKTFEATGYSTGFVLQDVASKMGIEYRPDVTYYTASTIKGPFIASLAAKNPSAISQNLSTVLSVLHDSSNEGYSSLRNRYGSSTIKAWASEAGLSPDKVKNLYAYLTPRELFALWNRNYSYFTSSERGREVASWFEKPNLSPIHASLGSHYTTQSKAGWIGYPGYHAANDAGVVYAPNGTYILSIMSDADGKLNLLNPIVSALDRLHTSF